MQIGYDSDKHKVYILKFNARGYESGEKIRVYIEDSIEENGKTMVNIEEFNKAYEIVKGS